MNLKLAICGLLLAGAVWAQPPKGTFNWWDSALAENIHLTGDQRLQIRQTIREYRGRLADERAAVAKAEADLDDVFNADQYDPRRGNDAIERLSNARAELTRTTTEMFLKLRFVLTPLQWQELQKRRPLGSNKRNGGAGAGQNSGVGH